MECPMCGGEGSELGSLGWRLHFRCRDCGMDYSVDTLARASFATAANRLLPWWCVPRKRKTPARLPR